ncbi:MAG: DUF2236 domain-containing protein [Gammaproteobacteria bacterium]|jgi:hypothetical protein|nr:DUF2236 domain-containing protein [Gammaproteobacteria bacterium]MBQ0774359.1 DUF2236 domain-containing protein [Gammaproteobacteria bacterium]
MNKVSKNSTSTDQLSDYLNGLKPIPLNGISPDPDSLVRWAAQRFEWLNVGDSLAEKAVQALRQAGMSLKQPARAVQQLAADGDKSCQALLADMHDTPGWVDYDLMRHAGAMAQRHFPMLILGLTYGGLPLTFAHPDAAEVFSGTGRMQANISRRLNESATLFFGIYNSDTLAPGKPMWEICLQVRLVHSVVRMGLIKKGWDVGRRGVPINQLSTAAGPAFFGTHQLGGLRRLGARISDDEALGFTMIWRYVTRLLGVPESLIGRTQAEQDEFDRHITSLFFAPDDNARSVMQDLIEGLATQKPTANLPRAMQLALFRRMLGDDMADAYGIERSRVGEQQLKFMLPLMSSYGWLQRTPLLAGLLRRTGQRFIERVATEGVVKLDDAGGHH